MPGWGTTGDLLFVSAGGYHHHLSFNTWKSKDGDPQPDGVTGLHHVALRYSTRAHLADALRRLQTAEWPVRALVDHGTHEAIYLADPDGNDLELTWDRPPGSGRAPSAGRSRTATSTSTGCSPSPSSARPRAARPAAAGRSARAGRHRGGRHRGERLDEHDVACERECRRPARRRAPRARRAGRRSSAEVSRAEVARRRSRARARPRAGATRPSGSGRGRSLRRAGFSSSADDELGEAPADARRAGPRRGRPSPSATAGGSVITSRKSFSFEPKKCTTSAGSTPAAVAIARNVARS